MGPRCKGGRQLLFAGLEANAGLRRKRELDGDPDLGSRWCIPTIGMPSRTRTAAMPGRPPFFEAEFRMPHKEGHWMWVLDRGMVVERDAERQWMRAIGTLHRHHPPAGGRGTHDLDAAQLADEKERLRVTLNSIGDAVICTDAAMRHIHKSRRGEARRRFVGAGDRCFASRRSMRPRTRKAATRSRRRRSSPGMRQRVDTTAGRCCEKGRFALQYPRSRLADPQRAGEVCGAVIVFQDFTDARALQRQLAHAAAREPLTGLANRATLMHAISGLV